MYSRHESPPLKLRLVFPITERMFGLCIYALLISQPLQCLFEIWLYLIVTFHMLSLSSIEVTRRAHNEVTLCYIHPPKLYFALVH